jgi:hypothetical protein
MLRKGVLPSVDLDTVGRRLEESLRGDSDTVYGPIQFHRDMNLVWRNWKAGSGGVSAIDVAGPVTAPWLCLCASVCLCLCLCACLCVCVCVCLCVCAATVAAQGYNPRGSELYRRAEELELVFGRLYKEWLVLPGEESNVAGAGPWNDAELWPPGTEITRDAAVASDGTPVAVAATGARRVVFRRALVFPPRQM